MRPADRPHVRPATALALLLAAALAAPAVPAADPGKAGDAAARADAGRDREHENEAAALAFVRENHPELAELLASLKPMRPDEYRRAIRDLAQVSQALGRLRQRDPARYALGLEAWKARSRVELLTARLAGGPAPSAGLEGQLRAAVEAQLDVEIRQQRHEKKLARERLKKATEALDRLESRRDQLAEARYRALLKRSQTARRQVTQSPKTRKSPTTTTTKPRARTDPDGPARGAGDGERLP